MDELQAGVELSLELIPQPWVSELLSPLKISSLTEGHAGEVQSVLDMQVSLPCEMRVQIFSSRSQYHL